MVGLTRTNQLPNDRLCAKWQIPSDYDDWRQTQVRLSSPDIENIDEFESRLKIPESNNPIMPCLLLQQTNQLISFLPPIAAVIAIAVTLLVP